MGPERFLLAYASGFARYGEYRANPLEQIAYDLQARFERGGEVFSVERLALDHLQEVAPTL